MAKSGMWRVSAHALERTVVPLDRGHGVVDQRSSPENIRFATLGYLLGHCKQLAAEGMLLLTWSRGAS